MHGQRAGTVTSRAAALAKVSGMMKRISGGTLPAHIDVTNMTVDQADHLLSGPTRLPSGTPVWYVRIYNPVTVTHSTPVVSPRPSDFNYAHGAAWVIEAQTGTVVRFTAFG
jgi:hypothetical protein